MHSWARLQARFQGHSKRIEAFCLQHMYFYTPPLAAKTINLPSYENSHELHTAQLQDSRTAMSIPTQLPTYAHESREPMQQFYDPHRYAMHCPFWDHILAASQAVILFNTTCLIRQQKLHSKVSILRIQIWFGKVIACWADKITCKTYSLLWSALGAAWGLQKRILSSCYMQELHCGKGCEVKMTYLAGDLKECRCLCMQLQNIGRMTHISMQEAIMTILLMDGLQQRLGRVDYGPYSCLRKPWRGKGSVKGNDRQIKILEVMEELRAGDILM